MVDRSHGAQGRADAEGATLTEARNPRRPRPWVGWGACTPEQPRRPPAAAGGNPQAAGRDAESRLATRGRGQRRKRGARGTRPCAWPPAQPEPCGVGKTGHRRGEQHALEQGSRARRQWPEGGTEWNRASRRGRRQCAAPATTQATSTASSCLNRCMRGSGRAMEWVGKTSNRQGRARQLFAKERL